MIHRITPCPKMFTFRTNKYIEKKLFSVNKTCLNRTHTCNCDFLDAKWHSDEGYYQTSKYGGLGITKMVFLQQENLQSDALGRITLGPLECVETSKKHKMTLNIILKFHV